MRLISGSLLILIVSQIIGQLIPPFSILLGTTFVIPIAVSFINFSNKEILGIQIKKDLPVAVRIVLVYLCVCASFFLDFLFAPGTKDAEGDALVLLSSFVALIASCIIMIHYQVRERKLKKNKINFGEMTLTVIVPLAWLLTNKLGTDNILYKLLD